VRAEATTTHGWLEQASQATMADGGPREDEAERVLQVVADAMIFISGDEGDRGMGSGLSSSSQDLFLMEANQIEEAARKYLHYLHAD
jgi:hypothetical protein